MAFYPGATERTFEFRKGFRSKPGIVVTTKPVGFPKYIKSLRDWNYREKLAAERGMKKAVQFLLKKALEVTPEDTGVLKKSGYWAYSKEGENSVGIVGFDAQICPYAVFVHEDLTKYHKPPTMAKFLSRTQWKYRGELSKIIRQEIEKVKPRT